MGRRWELEQVTNLVAGTRLVTLTGPGGCGKTRLAVEVARLVAGTKHVTWVDLQGQARGGLVDDAVLAGVGAPSGGDLPVAARVAVAVGERPTLLVLDNCEHVLESSASLVAELLEACAVLSVLATSREPLRTAAEVAWPVPSLDLPAAATVGRPSAEDLLATDAGRLFVDRATAAAPAFRLTDDDAPVLARLLHRLDAIPLAIELAAVRVRAMSLSALGDAVDDRFGVLTTGDRSKDPRQRTLLASVQWSYDLLSPRERVVLRRLSVFAGPFTTVAAEAIVAGEGVEMTDVLPTLLLLVERSLVSPDPMTDGADRYVLLDTIRAFAADRLAEAEAEGGERERLAVRRRHRAFFAARAAAAAEEIDGHDRPSWIVALDAESPDLLAAIRTAVDDGEGDTAARMASGLGRYWAGTNRVVAGAAVLGEVTALEGVDAASAAGAWRAASEVAMARGDWLNGIEHGERAVALAEQAGDLRMKARALGFVAETFVIADPARATAAFTEAAAIARSHGDRWCLAKALVSEALTLVYLADAEGARRRLDEARAIAIDIGDQVRLAWHAVAEGWLLSLEGDVHQAEHRLRDAVRRSEETGDPSPLGLATGFLAESMAVAGRAIEADVLLRWNIADHEALGESLMLEPLRLQRAMVLGIAGRCEEALDLFEAALDAPGIAELPFLREQILLGIGTCRLALGADQAATPLADLVASPDPGSPLARCLARVRLGEALRRDGGGATAAGDVRAALRIAFEGGFGHVTNEALATVARLDADQRPALAARLVGAAREDRNRRGVVSVWLDLTEDVETHLRPVLGDAEWDRLEADGRTLSAEQAAELALAVGEDRPVAGWSALTKAERRVAELAAQGLQNAAIGEALFVSRETVKTHLSHVFAKLGVRNRAELAARYPPPG